MLRRRPVRGPRHSVAGPSTDTGVALRMSELRRFVSVLPDGTWNHNVIRNAVERLGAAIQAHGLEHVALDGTAPDFERDLLHHATDSGTALYFGYSFYDISLVHAGGRGDIRRNLFDMLDRPVFALLQDHPFSHFMRSRIEASARSTYFVSPTPEFEAEARFINPALRHFHTIAPAMTETVAPDSEVKPLAERPIDFFMSCAFFGTKPSLEEFRSLYAKTKSPMVTVIDEVYATGMAQRDVPLLDLFRASFKRQFDKPLALKSPLTQRDMSVVTVLSVIDTRIRFERRLKVLRSLARLDPALRIVVTMEPHRATALRELAERPNIELVGRIPSDRAREFFLNARFAINVTPTYTTYVTERVSNAMNLGCCLVSDRNRHFATTFGEGEEILFMEDCDLAPLAHFFGDDLAQAQDIAKRGRARALADFTVERQAEDLLAIMRQVH